MKKDIAVDGCSFSSSKGGSVTATSTPSFNCKAGGKGIYKDSLGVSVSLASDGTCTLGNGSGSIPSTASKCKADGSLVMRVDDEVSVDCVGQDFSSGPPVPCNFSTTVKISNAGQSKVQGE